MQNSVNIFPAPNTKSRQIRTDTMRAVCVLKEIVREICKDASKGLATPPK